MNEDIEKEILYWVDYFDYQPKESTGKLIDYIKEHYVRDIDEVVNEYIEVMEIKVPNKDILNKKKICQLDDDYDEIGYGYYLNVKRLEEDELDLIKEGLIE